MKGTADSPCRRSACARWRPSADGDWNILLTNSLTPESRMMIHRKIPERVGELADFSVGTRTRIW